MPALVATNPVPLRDNMDRTCHFFSDMPKNCIKTIRYIVEWSIIFFPKLLVFSQITRATSALKHGTAIFIIPECITELNTFRFKTIDWITGRTDTSGKRISFTNFIVSFGDATNKVCETGKWLWETKILSISMTVASKLMLVNGLSMMFGFSNRIYNTINDLQSCNYQDRTLKMWKLAKYTALFALGTFIAIASVTSFINPVLMITYSTISLISSFATYIIEHPLE